MEINTGRQEAKVLFIISAIALLGLGFGLIISGAVLQDIYCSIFGAVFTLCSMMGLIYMHYWRFISQDD